MSKISEIRAADTLAIALERESLVIVAGLMQFFKAPDNAVTQASLETMIYSSLVNSVGKMWKPQMGLLQETLGKEDFIKVSKLRWPEIYAKNKEIASSVLRYNSLAPLSEVGAVLNDVIADQVDTTQEIEGAKRGIKWARHADSGACKWCREQISVYASTKKWLRHGNCRCFKVKA